MTRIQQQGSNLPENLPLLTEVADDNVPDDLPTLTEAIQEAPAESATVFQPRASEETPPHETTTAVPCFASEEDMQRLLQHLETHIENILTYKLNLNLEQLQRVAIQHAVNDLKAELPELLREALNRRPGL